ncbi:MAG TPA: ABC transporter permease [Actinomycetota bacterium]|jgi:putative ABC transport system permease protein|nr:ABC transporter permease [Actinomycetota bacterium]
MWRAALRDLQWRRRRFVIAVLATSLVFGMTLLMTGFSTSLHNEGRRIVVALGADGWLVAAGAPGPFTTSTPIPAADANRVAAAPGVERADPLVILHATIRRPAVRDVNLIGARPGGLGTPPLVEGHAVAGPGEVVADTELGLHLGDRMELSGTQLQVVGLADQVTWYFGTPTLFLALEDAQAVAFDGQPLATVVLTKGIPRTGLPGLTLLSNAQAVDDLERPLVRGTQSIDLISALLWLVAAGIIGSIVYLSALERLREFAVFKATGASNRSLLVGLALQAVVLSATAAVLAVGIAQLLGPMFPFAVEIPPLAFPRLLVLAMLVGLAASVAGLRRAVSVQPALAFGGP